MSVSVVIPSTGHRSSLRDAVTSALCQTVRPAELVVVADGPGAERRVRAVLDGVDVGATRLVIAGSEVRRGPAAARNRGVRAASGDLIAFLDDDDAWYPEKTALQLEALAGSGARDFTLTRCLIRTERGDYVLPRRLPRSGESIADYLFGPRTSLLRPSAFVATPSLVAPRRALLDLPFDESMTSMEDFDWMIRAQQRGMGVVYVDRALTAVEARDPVGRRSLSRQEVIDDRWLLEWARRVLTPRQAATFTATHWFRILCRSARRPEAVRDYLALVRREPRALRHLPTVAMLLATGTGPRGPLAAIAHLVRRRGRGTASGDPGGADRGARGRPARTPGRTRTPSTDEVPGFPGPDVDRELPPMSGRSVLVTGGSGFIGTHLVEALVRAGATVTNLDVRAPNVEAHRAYWRECDVLDEPSLGGAIAEAAPEVVYHLAAVADIRSDAASMRVNTAGLAHVLDQARRVPGSPLVVHFSTQLVAEPGHQPTGPLDFAPYTEYGVSKAASEELLHQAGDGPDWVIVRPTTVWGPWHPTFPDQLWRYLERGLYVHPGGRDPRRSYGYVGNVVHQVVRLAQVPRETVVGRTLYVGDDAIPSAELLDAFSVALRGRPARRVPRWLLRLAAEAGELSGRLGGPSPLDRGRWFRMTTDYVVPMAPTFETVGRGPVTLADGVDESVRWLRERRRPPRSGSAAAAGNGTRLVMAGPFPPPLGGAAKITEAVRQELRGRGLVLRAVDLSADALSHSRSLDYHLLRLGRNLRGALTLVWESRRSRVLYLVADGGLGVWYTLLHALVAARTYERVFVHHHTHRYIDRHDVGARLVTRVLGRRATHVFLTPGMAHRYQERYGAVRAVTVGNAWFTPRPTDASPGPSGSSAIRVGHLGNLCGEKGFFRVADAFDALRAAGVDAELHLAGPVVDERVPARLDTLRRVHGHRLTYVGPVDGAAKAAFYRSLDVFLFPTEFVQEAAPNVLFEAAAAGVPSLCTDRGCIPELLDQLEGASCPAAADFAAFALEHVPRARLTDDDRARIRSRFQQARDLAAREAADLFDTLVDGRVGGAPASSTPSV